MTKIQQTTVKIETVNDTDDGSNYENIFKKIRCKMFICSKIASSTPIYEGLPDGCWRNKKGKTCL